MPHAQRAGVRALVLHAEARKLGLTRRAGVPPAGGAKQPHWEVQDVLPWQGAQHQATVCMLLVLHAGVLGQRLVRAPLPQQQSRLCLLPCQQGNSLSFVAQLKQVLHWSWVRCVWLFADQGVQPKLLDFYTDKCSFL